MSMTTSGSYSGFKNSAGIAIGDGSQAWGDLRRTRIAQRKNRPHQTTAVGNKKFQDFQIEDRLTTNANGRGVEFVAFVLYGFLNCRAKV